ncbi:MAG: hypothetical protein GF411_02725 [Candidatus Lokiarchaeota archaeon]|nr:hypothetical protein [Candidatus Lokiarchaeota archaeon]
MAVYLSPGVYPNEIDLSLVATGAGPLRPAFIGTAKKGPLNTPTLITNAEQYLDTFGDPFPESYMGYAVLAYLEEGSQCFVERVGVEAEAGQVADLAAIAIDTSGAKVEGWGRIPVFTGIDNGKIALRVPSVDEPYEFHEAAVFNIDFNDIDVDTVDGPTTATLNFVGSGLSNGYTGSIDDSFTILITSGPSASSGSTIDEAEYAIIRNSDGETIATGTIAESTTPGESDPIEIGSGDDDTGLICQIIVTGTSPLEENDTFTFEARPDNLTFGFSADRATANTYSFSDGDSYTDVDSFVTAFNALLSGEDYSAVNLDGVPVIRTDTAGDSIQLLTTEAWSLEVGQSLYAWDIPRSYLISTDAGPFNITSSNNRVKIDVIGETTATVEFSVTQGLNQTPQQIATSVDLGGTYLGEKYWKSYALQVTDDEYRLVIEASEDHRLSMLYMQANASNIKTLRFAEELEILYPYKRAYRGYSDSRVELPESGSIDPSTPASCEADPGSAQCALDSSYYQNIVGWFVANSAGTWIDDYTLSLEIFTEGVGDSAGRYTILIYDSNNLIVDRTEDVSFDRNEDRYISNVINPGSRFGGVNGNAYVSWEDRPTYLANDETASDYEVREPSELFQTEFLGAANGIPTDPIYSSELDRAVIGNPGLSTGIFAFQNPEAYDINLLATPGFSSGAVIGQAIQLCSSRGDMLYIVDPPYGLRPQQVVDWHNGMLLSDLSQAINSSYGALYWSWLKIFDQFSGEEIWIPPSGHVMAVFARTARVGEQWFAPAGLNRGRLLTPRDIEYNPTLGERDLLYGSGNAVNPIVNFTQEGITVWGQRTLQRRSSSLDRVNVRMLLIYLKKNLIRLLRNFNFEQNDEILWAQVEDTTVPFLGDVAARRGIDQFKVVCDETNNTPERRQRNELWVSVFIKPTLVAEFIVLNLVVLRQDASFTADEVLAAGGVVA